MDNRQIAKIEIFVFTVLILLFIGFLVPSLQYARRERQDGVRRDEIALLKQSLEQKNNEVGYYPIEFDASPYTYIVEQADAKAAIAWYLRTELENPSEEVNGFDEEGGRNYYFRVVKEEGKTYYDVCGGTFTCGVDERN